MHVRYMTHKNFYSNRKILPNIIDHILTSNNFSLQLQVAPKKKMSKTSSSFQIDEK